MRTSSDGWVVAIALLVGTVSLAACSGAAAGSVVSGRVPVVAAENFYGDIVAQLGGPYVSVTSILSDPNADPHLFEPGTANAAAVADARLVVDNGLGYDAFMDRLLAAAPNSKRTVVTIAKVFGFAGGGVNPHLWYDAPRIPDMAKAIADALSTVGPAHRGYFAARLAAFDDSLKPLLDAVAALRASAMALAASGMRGASYQR